MNRIKEIDSLISATERKLSQLDEQRKAFQYQLNELKHQREILIKQTKYDPFLQAKKPSVTIHSSESEKISLFRSLFRGREDVFARRFESVKTGKSGYQPCCRNEWVKGICRKPKIKCSDCDNRDFFPITDEVIKCHLLGVDLHERSICEFTIGIYPLLHDETCWFLAVDFNKEFWMDDVTAFMGTCESYNVPTALERSRSGKGGQKAGNIPYYCNYGTTPRDWF